MSLERGTGRERGIGLLEILIAVVLISIGFLAAARMQVQGMRFSQSAYFQSQAHLLGSDMIDRMRANLAGIELGAYDAVDTSTAVSDPKCGRATLCTPEQQAQQDVHDWRAYFQPPDGTAVALLPGKGDTPPKGTVTGLPDERFEVRIEWYESIGGVDTPQSLSSYFVAERN